MPLGCGPGSKSVQRWESLTKVMTHVLERHHHALVALCRKYRVKRLDAFGSAIRGDFDERSSDVDLLVEFEGGRMVSTPPRIWDF
jgi:predicted nucleotidyltransferase